MCATVHLYFTNAVIPAGAQRNAGISLFKASDFGMNHNNFLSKLSFRSGTS